MNKILIITFLTFSFLFSSTLDDLKITDEDFIKISHSSKKDIIFDRINELMLLKKSLKGVSNDFIKLTSVNNFFNEYDYETDDKLYKKADYWATRKEFLFKGAGDCEDFAIAKFFTLLDLGVDEGKLSLLHGIYNNQYHVVLAYQKEQFGDTFILDSLDDEIKPLTNRNDILILYTLKTIDLKNSSVVKTDLEYLNNYKWTEIYLRSIESVN